MSWSFSTEKLTGIFLFHLPSLQFKIIEVFTKRVKPEFLRQWAIGLGFVNFADMSFWN